jgi:GNAT superfamily N-acetyltransferase
VDDHATQGSGAAGAHELTCRPVGPGDAAALVPLLGELGYPATADEVTQRLARLAHEPSVALWAADAGGELVGLAAAHTVPLVTRDAPLCRIAALIVAARARGTGVGRALVEQVVRHARERGCDRVEVTSAERRADAHAFYRRLGFEDTSRRFIKDLSVL